MKHFFTGCTGLALIGMAGLLAGCVNEQRPSGAVAEVAGVIQKRFEEKTKKEPQFERWLAKSGKYTAADLAGRWNWTVGAYNPANHTYAFQDSGTKIEFVAAQNKAGSVDFVIRGNKKESKGTAIVSDDKPQMLTLLMARSGDGKDKPASDKEKGQPAPQPDVPVGSYVTLYVVDGAQSALVLWNPANDSVCQARRVVAERTRGLADAGGGDILPELPPSANLPTIPTAPKPANPPVAVTPTPTATPTTPIATPTPTPTTPTPKPPTAEAPTDLPIVAPPPPKLPSIVGTWQLMDPPAVFPTYLIFKSNNAYEMYFIMHGRTTLADCGEYVLDGDRLTQRSMSSGQISMVNLRYVNNVLMASVPGRGTMTQWIRTR